MKQTLDSAFDPGPLLLYGPNVKVTDYSQMFSRGKARYDQVSEFSAGMRTSAKSRTVAFTMGRTDIRISTDTIRYNDREIRLTETLTPPQRNDLKLLLDQHADAYLKIVALGEKGPRSWTPLVARNRCFLEPSMRLSIGNARMALPVPIDEFRAESWVSQLQGIIHVPGLRGNPERAYQRSAVGATYPGTFETYVASIIFEWGKNDPQRLQDLATDLERLGLTWKVIARKVDNASVELLVGRMPHAQQGGALDLVSVADVGFGVSQTLPVLVALRSARPGQLVYIEQPEIHLHPKAQLELANCLVAAASRGVRVVAETHSSLLIRGIQTAVARGDIPSTSLSFNWFSRDPKDGFQKIEVAELDSAGRFGEWPIDFDDIGREADWAYLEAVEATNE